MSSHKNHGHDSTAPTTPPVSIISASSSNIGLVKEDNRQPSSPPLSSPTTPLQNSIDPLKVESSLPSLASVFTSSSNNNNNDSDEDEIDELLPQHQKLRNQRHNSVDNYLSSPITNDTSPSLQPLSIDNARSAASISNLINHDDDHSSVSPTSQMSSRSISPSPETPHNNVSILNEPRFISIEFHNTNNSDFSSSITTKKKRKGAHDTDDDISKNKRISDSSKRQRKNIHKSSSSTSVSNTPISATSIIDEPDDLSLNGSIPPSPVPSSGFDEMIIDDHVSDDFPSSTSPTNTSANITFSSKQNRKKPYIPPWPDYKYQPRRRVVGPTFKKPLKGPGAPTKLDNVGDFDTGSRRNINNHVKPNMDNFVMEISNSFQRKSSIADEIPINDSHDSRELTDITSQRKSIIIIERGSKELNKIGDYLLYEIQHSTSSQITTRLPPPHTLVVPPMQLLPPTQSTMILPNTPSPPAATARGALIVLEGCEDGTTALQSTKLLEFLKNEGIKARLWKFPDTTTPSGTALKAYRSSNRQPHPKTLHLLVAAHWWELMPIMKEHLINGTTLIVDKYVYSSIAASASAGLDLNWCKASYVHLLCPDLIFFLNVERESNELDQQSQSPQSTQLPHVNDVLGAGSNDDESRRASEWQKRLQDAFARLAEVQWKILDARKSNTLVHTQILEASIEVIERCRKYTTGYNSNINNFMPQNQFLFPPPPPNQSSSSSPPPPSQLSQSAYVLPTLML
ncbi:21504_t:CDS:2 [Cetraspora pellucida]|uniref:21504_t:CDS:1 n=1 Tax=Cetraspora pellucida TaxID=1433469 RepID=A0A9N9D180_9GLOM|nr:21504_t:CDS:2 [Cetraspora pellucida]